MRMLTAPEPGVPALTSFSIFRTTTSAAGVTHAATPKVISGTSVPTIHGRGISLVPRERMLETVAKEAEERAARAAQERLNTESNAREDAEQAKRVALEQLGRER